MRLRIGLACFVVLVLFGSMSGCSKKTDLQCVQLTEKPMNADAFWRIIDQAHADGGHDLDARVEALRTLLAPLSTEELQSFQNHYDHAIKAAYRWDLWGAAYIINGGCSDDGFRYFLDWLISEGSRTYTQALKSPDSLAALRRVDYAENELFAYVAMEVFEKKGGGELERDFSIEISPPAGQEWKDSHLPRMFPNLAKLYEFEL